jgi:hypothetical protein
MQNARLLFLHKAALGRIATNRCVVLRSQLRRKATRASVSLSSLSDDGTFLCLERAVGDRRDADAQLWKSGAFKAQIFPDLPIVGAWSGAFTKGSAVNAPPPAALSTGNGFTVQTVAAQCRTAGHIKDIMMSVSSKADAMLLVSGSHPLRRLPGAQLVLPSSFSMLKMASQLRQQGYLPASLSLWAVENPNVAPVDRLARKIAAGAEVIVTQPPFLWDTSTQWFEQAARLHLSDNVKIVVGVPMITSQKNLEFWLALCDTRSTPEGQALLESLGGMSASGFQAWNEEFIQRVGCPVRRMVLFAELSY